MRLRNAIAAANLRTKQGVPVRFPQSIMGYFFIALLAMALVIGWHTLANAAGVDCSDSASALEYWRPIREQAPTATEPADDLALELLPCLGSPNPELRDQIGYELFTFWLRGNALTDDTRRTLLTELSELMIKPAAATDGDSSFARSFSALILAEIMRSDANRPFMSVSERQVLLDRATRSLERESDFRGLDANFGWIHPVAHISDLLWRFALHPETTATQAESILDAVRSKVAPTTVFYSFNESDRLARVVATTIRQKIVAPEKVGAWIRSFETPSSMEKWSDAFVSTQGMAELHNTKLFLRALADQLNDVDTDRLIAEPLGQLVRGLTQLI